MVEHVMTTNQTPTNDELRAMLKTLRGDTVLSTPNELLRWFLDHGPWLIEEMLAAREERGVRRYASMPGHEMGEG
jgi:hypothetical protein